jgi:hypothetical protein
MKRKLFLFSFVVFQFTNLFSQSQLTTDSSVKVFPHWKKGEIHSVLIKSSTEQFADGKNKKSLTSFEARFTVLEKDTSGYSIQWVYTKSDLPADELNIENIILANLLNQNFIFKLSLTGRFRELMNYDEVKSAFDPLIDRLISRTANDRVKNIGLNAVKQMITNRRSFEIVLLKQVKFYNLSFGFKYRTHFIQTNPLTFPNPLGGTSFKATEKIQLTKLDTTGGICIIERNSTVDDRVAFKNQIMGLLQTVEKQDSTDIQNRFGNVEFELSEKSVQEINYLNGILLKANFTSVANFGFEYRTSGLEVETIPR